MDHNICLKISLKINFVMDSLRRVEVGNRLNLKKIRSFPKWSCMKISRRKFVTAKMRILNAIAQLKTWIAKLGNLSNLLLMKSVKEVKKVKEEKDREKFK